MMAGLFHDVGKLFWLIVVDDLMADPATSVRATPSFVHER